MRNILACFLLLITPYILSQLTKDNKMDTSLINSNIFQYLSAGDLFELALNKISSTYKGFNNTIKIDIDNIIKSMENESYKFHSTNKIVDEKVDGNTHLKNYKVVALVNIENEVVMEVIYNILNAIYASNLHSFDIKNNETDLFNNKPITFITKTFKEINLLIRGNIKQSLTNSINANIIIINILSKRISDKKFLNLLERLFHEGNIELNDFNPQAQQVFIAKNNSKDTAKNKLLSLLVNIYIYEFEQYIKTLQKSFNIGAAFDSKKQERKVNNLLKQYNLTQRKGSARLFEIQKSLGELGVIYEYRWDKYVRIFKSFHYVRKDGEFLIGLGGSENEIILINNQIMSHFNTYNNIIPDFIKTSIVKTSDKKTKIRFLKYIINFPLTKRKIKALEIKEALIEKLIKDQFCQYVKSTKIQSLPKLDWIAYSHKDIIDLYNKATNTILDNIVDINNNNLILNKSNKKLLWKIIQSSTAKLLAAKYKLKNQKNVFAKFGKTLGNDSSEGSVGLLPIF